MLNSVKYLVLGACCSVCQVVSGVFFVVAAVKYLVLCSGVCKYLVVFCVPREFC